MGSELFIFFEQFNKIADIVDAYLLGDVKYRGV